MNDSTHKRPRLRRLLVPLIAAATIVVPVAPAEDYSGGLGIPVKGESYVAPEPAASVPTSTTFQWSDAAVGAGSSLAIVGLAMGGYLVLRRHRLHVRLS
jgi:hypothetical protein